mmetsp:Transcript_4366/g.12822  ORF Transcript_4366/g.12822 Transcript_4366/m.12822 type:complete len:116 (+) Transcript_4366:3113-3460(+)
MCVLGLRTTGDVSWHRAQSGDCVASMAYGCQESGAFVICEGGRYLEYFAGSIGGGVDIGSGFCDCVASVTAQHWFSARLVRRVLGLHCVWNRGRGCELLLRCPMFVGVLAGLSMT